MEKLNENSLDEINRLILKSELYSQEIVSVEKLTAGNMNLTLRAIDQEGRSLIIKQGREFVEKYPSVPAPIGRTSVEFEYYNTIKRNPFLVKMSPKIISMGHENQILLIEDLGNGIDGISYYNNPDSLQGADLKQMINYLSDLHEIKKENVLIENTEMKKLNALHMFDFPFTNEGRSSLESNFPELSKLSVSLINNKKRLNACTKLKDLYLSSGEILAHGDFYPGSFFLIKDNIYVIDPEFCFWGYPEFDLGIFLGHLLIIGKEKALFDEALKSYLKNNSNIDLSLINQHAGIEILRRLYGVAQLPLQGQFASLEYKEQLTETALSLL